MHELATLLAPVTPREFVRRYLGRESLHVRGRPSKTARLGVHLDLDAIVEIARVLGKDAVFATWRQAKRLESSLVDPEEIRRRLDAGASLCLTGIERAHPGIAALTAALRFQLGWTGPVDARCYISPDGEGAFPMHWDTRVAITLQLSGRKIWEFEPRGPIPFPNGGNPDEVKGAELCLTKKPRVLSRVELRPGDVLILPPGARHSAKAVGRSIAVNFALNYHTGSTMEMLLAMLEERLAERPEWRAPPTPGLDREQRARPELRFLHDRIDDLAKIVAELRSDDRSLEAHWRSRLLQATGIAQQAESPNGRTALARTSLLRVSPSAIMSCGLVADGSRLEYAVGNGTRSLSTSEEGIHFFDNLVRRKRSFRAAECLKWSGGGGEYEWRDIKELLETLIAEGVVVSASSGVVTR